MSHKNKSGDAENDLAALLRDFSRSDSGHAALLCLSKSKITIDRNAPFPNKSIFGAYCFPHILLNPEAEPATLLSGLRHEIRHVEQEQNGLAGQEKGALTQPVRDPRAFVSLQLLREADAYAHQVDFAFEHAKTTGDQAPKKILARELPGIFNAYAKARQAPGGTRGKALQQAFAAYMKDDGHKRFDAIVALAELDQILKSQQKMAKASKAGKKMLLESAGNPSPDARTVHAFGRTQTSPGRHMNYFNGLSSRQLTGPEFSGTLPKAVEKRLKKMEQRYARFFAALEGGKQ